MRIRDLLLFVATVNFLHAADAIAQTVTYNADDQRSDETYDANGNTLTTGGKTFVYDSENHLISMNGGSVTLTYDGDGNLVSKTVNGVTTRYLVDKTNPTGMEQVTEEIVNGTVQRRYSFGSQITSQTLFLNNNTTVTSFYGFDGQGNVRQLTNSAGTVTDTFDYDAFGNLIGHTGTTPNHMLYRGERYDTDLGLYYLRARWYNPLTGRFLSRDPEAGDPQDPASLHKYSYAEADPVNKVDPSGRDAGVATMPGAPARTATGGGDAVEYAGIVLMLGLGEVAAEKSVACKVNIALSSEGVKLLGGTPIPGPDECLRKGKSCKTEFPEYIPLDQLWYPFTNRFAALLEAAANNGGRQPRGGSVDTALRGPCGELTSSYVPGTHQNLYSGGQHVGDIVSCKACDDSSGEPTLVDRWDYIPGHE